MRGLVLGNGAWWRVEVVLRHATSHADQRELLSAVTRLLDDSASMPAKASDPEAARSYDANPPEGGVGIAMWVQSETLGSAADGAVGVVMQAGTQITGTAGWASIWDVRVVPADAVLGARPGVPLSK